METSFIAPHLTLSAAFSSHQGLQIIGRICAAERRKRQYANRGDS
jgi:hypothetical protein